MASATRWTFCFGLNTLDGSRNTNKGKHPFSSGLSQVSISAPFILDQHVYRIQCCITTIQHLTGNLYSWSDTFAHDQHLEAETKWPTFRKRHFETHFLKKWISITISLKFVPTGPINKIPASIHIIAWRRPDDKLLSEALLVSLLTHICVTRPQWVKLDLMHTCSSSTCDATVFHSKCILS